MPQPFSTSVPAGRGEQPPSSPGRLQATHAPLHELAQHTPSTQAPEAQSEPEVQGRPLPFGPVQLPPLQSLPDLHSEPEVHVASQLAAPVQKLPPHSEAGSVPAASAVQTPEVPARLHAVQVPLQAPSQQTPSAQKPEGHCAPSTHPEPSGRRGMHVPPLQ